MFGLKTEGTRARPKVCVPLLPNLHGVDYRPSGHRGGSAIRSGYVRCAEIADRLSGKPETNRNVNHRNSNYCGSGAFRGLGDYRAAAGSDDQEICDGSSWRDRSFVAREGICWVWTRVHLAAIKIRLRR